MKAPFIILAFLSLSQQNYGQKDTLIYIGDPMCSWCYGFSPQLDIVKERFPNLNFKMIMGGLRAGNDETITSLKDFLSEHWQEVNQKTGQPFSYAILNDSKMIYDTEPSCRAIVTMRQISPKNEYAFFKDAQSAFYYENKNPLKVETYQEMVKKYGLSPDKFKKHFESEVLLNETKKDFAFSATLGVTGFPSLVLLKEGKIHRIANGYQSANQIISKLEQLGL